MNSAMRGCAGHVRAGTGVLLAFLICSTAPVAAQGVTDPPVNVVKSIVAKGNAIEIELHSSKAFPVRSEVVVLRVGTKEFSKSRTDADGSLNTLIFILKEAEFEQLADGEPLTVAYGRQDSDGVSAQSPKPSRSPRWAFGTLRKSLLSR